MLWFPKNATVSAKAGPPPAPKATPAVSPVSTTASPVVAAPQKIRDKKRLTKKAVPKKTPKATKIPSPSGIRTPKKKIAWTKGLLPGQRSPERMQNGVHCKGCNHGDLKNLQLYGPKYFTMANLKDKQHYPEFCSGGCERSLLPGKDPKKFCKVTPTFMVCCCSNAINHDDIDCVFAVCTECYVKKDGSSRGTRIRTQTNLLAPSEKQLPDG